VENRVKHRWYARNVDAELQQYLAQLEGRLATHIHAAAARMEQRIEAAETRMADRIELAETRLLTEFHKWASPMEARHRAHSATLRAIHLELEALGERVDKLEGKKPS
jgi:ubiquinone biosynthesis protein UbiJ